MMKNAKPTPGIVPAPKSATAPVAAMSRAFVKEAEDK
jgi:hypothetical protein